MPPYDFSVKYVPGSQMRINDYLSRDPFCSALEPQDESELAIALNKELNAQKNTSDLKTAAEVIQNGAFRPRNFN